MQWLNAGKRQTNGRAAISACLHHFMNLDYCRPCHPRIVTDGIAPMKPSLTLNLPLLRAFSTTLSTPHQVLVMDQLTRGCACWRPFDRGVGLEWEKENLTLLCFLGSLSLQLSYSGIGCKPTSSYTEPWMNFCSVHFNIFKGLNR